jgi:hypothetical protein
MKCALLLSLAALASAGFLEKAEEAKIEKTEETIANSVESFGQSHMTAQAAAMKSMLEAQLAYWSTEEGKKEHEKALKVAAEDDLKEAAEELQWFADVAHDGFMQLGEGLQFPLLDKDSPLGKLPKGLPEPPKDPKELEKFYQVLPVSPGTYSTMLALKKDPSVYLEIAQKEHKNAVASLVELDILHKDLKYDENKPQAMVQNEDKQSSIEVLKASPKAFKQALKAWEKMVPEAASMLLQTEMAESAEEAKDAFMQAKDLASKATTLHQEVFDSVEQVTDKDLLMSVAQNRITSLLMRQSEASLSDFNALEGCSNDRGYAGAEARCLCVADNICNKSGQARGGEYCSIVSSATCMSPQNKKEATEMSTV